MITSKDTRTQTLQNQSLKYVHLSTLDGLREYFPISPHVLTIKNRVYPKRQPLIKQGAALMLAASIFVSSFGISYGNVGTTLSYFRDNENSIGNILRAGLLDFLVADGTIARTITATSTPIVIPVMTPEAGSFPTLYKVTAEQTGGNTALCTALNAVATTSPFLYSGSLLALSPVATTTTGVWNLGLTLSSTDGFSNGAICNIDLIYRGWYPDAPEYTGFTDEERVHLIITYQAVANEFDIVLNEFLPNPDTSANGLDLGTDSDSKPLGEWIELYNKGDIAQDIAGWFMTDASGGVGNTHAVIGASNTNTGSTIIPAHGWLVVYMNKPSLNNTGDEIHLYTSSNVQVDFYSYDDPSDFCKNDPTSGYTNATTTPPSGTPGNGPDADCVANQVAPNKSYARIPDGTGAFVDPIPTPGFQNTALNFPEETITAVEDVAPLSQPEEPVVEPIVISSGGSSNSSPPPELAPEIAPEESATTTEEHPEEPAVEPAASTTEEQQTEGTPEETIDTPIPDATIPEQETVVESGEPENTPPPEANTSNEQPPADIPADPAPVPESSPPPPGVPSVEGE